ncbi:DNA-binding protein [Thalassotalea sp. HSM 43]|uniref:helix-turn-helix domain-containing protein n=1 Tax=Thalassotalea sp. HSM 43 TaxID=2552945 RepID=UPI0010801EC4|nr:helix-turn-helix domain-containing protein [Thalassotalea sp. HSM 43]QBY02939.1 DNA-binding protein [Thalassotalea sp. HSM 43]
MKRNHNPNKCKINRFYTVEEVSMLLDVHKHTVRNWILKGLAVCDDKRPVIILGKDLKAFLQKQRQQGKRKCKPSELYCMKCREPRIPDQKSIEFIKETNTKGRVIAACSHCNSSMNKYFKLDELATIQRDLAVILPLQQKHIG